MVDIQSMTSFQISELNTTMINVSSTVFGISVNVYMNETSPSCAFSPVSRPDSQYNLNIFRGPKQVTYKKCSGVFVFTETLSKIM